MQQDEDVEEESLEAGGESNEDFIERVVKEHSEEKQLDDKEEL